MVKITIALLFLFLSLQAEGQAPVYNFYYRIYFSDKGNNSTSDFIPSRLLSERAIERRAKAGIYALNFNDIPVSGNYLNQITSLGLKLHCTSKWMNTALFRSINPVDINILKSLPFVSSVRVVKTGGGKHGTDEKLHFDLMESNDFQFDRPITMLNGYTLHDQGYDGKGILIAVLDGGFDNTEEISSLSDLRNRKGIKATFDFVNNTSDVYSSSTHGTAVLSVLAGKIPFVIEGTAPGAEYLLLKTEDVASEYPYEEDLWAAGAEFADSAGADIITTSLGYSTFDDPSLNYKYSDLDGNSAFVTIAADIAASKGILVFSSAGNERNKSWKRIICPSDGDSVVAVGAVDGNKLISVFSSAGFSYDRRIKPDNAAMGVAVTVQTSVTSIGRANGTSFSCPVLSGMSACLMQAVQGATITDIISVLRESSDRYTTPDSLYGYGIPDMGAALLRLQDIVRGIPDKISVAGPNPTSGEFEIVFKEAYSSITVEIFTTAGRLIWKKKTDNFAGRILRISELEKREQGLYLVRVSTPSATMVHKIIKLRK